MRLIRLLVAAASAAALAVSGACTSSSTSVTSPSAGKCQVQAASQPSSFTSGGGPGTLTISADRDCTWSVAADASWIAGAPPEAQPGLAAKTRYRQADAACSLAVEGAAEFALDFSAPQWAMTPGQAAVLYRGEECLGGGVIRGPLSAAGVSR